MKKGKYVSEDERGGFKVAKVNLPLSDGKLRLFLEGKEDWLEEGSSMAQEGGAQQNYVPPFGGIPAPPSYYSGVPMQAWGSGAAMPPPNFAVPNIAFAETYAHLLKPQQNVATIGGYAARNMQNIAAILTNANLMGEGNADVACVLGHLHLAPSDNS
jgi:hypothetical protein